MLPPTLVKPQQGSGHRWRGWHCWLPPRPLEQPPSFVGSCGAIRCKCCASAGAAQLLLLPEQCGWRVCGRRRLHLPACVCRPQHKCMGRVILLPTLRLAHSFFCTCPRRTMARQSFRTSPAACRLIFFSQARPRLSRHAWALHGVPEHCMACLGTQQQLRCAAARHPQLPGAGCPPTATAASRCAGPA